MKILNSVQSVYTKKHILAITSARHQKLTLIRTNYSLSKIEKLSTFKGSKSFLLTKTFDIYLLSVDNKLLASNDLNEWKEVLKVRKRNIIWHTATTPQNIVAQEYGEKPTTIFTSENGYNWEKTLTNIEVDPKSLHFHYITYSPQYNALYATLGDGNLIRAIKIQKNTWKPIYIGPWQFVPITTSKNNIMFGIDSAIAKGGIGIHHPPNKWKFIFLKWRNKKVKFTPMSNLKKLDNNLWITALGTPQAILVSKNLKKWHPAHIEGYSKQFNFHTTISEEKTYVACTTGKNLLLFKKKELEKITQTTQPTLTNYKAYIDKIKGLGFTLKRKISK